MTRRRRERIRERPPVSTDHYRNLTNPFEPMRVMSDDQVAHMHDVAVRYLADEGIRVLFPEARQIFAAAGAAVDDDMVRLDPEAVAAALAAAPESFEIHAPNPKRTLTVGGAALR